MAVNPAPAGLWVICDTVYLLKCQWQVEDATGSVHAQEVSGLE